MQVKSVVPRNPDRFIPVPLVRANQAWLTLATLAAIWLQWPWLIAALFVLTALPLIGGSSWHLVFLAVRSVRGDRLNTVPAEPAESQRFHQAIAAALLLGGSLFVVANSLTAAWVMTAALTVFAGSALLGPCIGCRLFGPWRAWAARQRANGSPLLPFVDFVAGKGF